MTIDTDTLVAVARAYFEPDELKWLPLLAKNMARDEWAQEPLPIREFLFTPGYGAHVGRAIWPKLVDILEEIYAGEYVEILLSGSIRWGKTFLTSTLTFYELYRLGCMGNPQEKLGLSSTSNIVLTNLSLSGAKAKNTLFSEVKNMVDGSEWFRKYMPRNKHIESELRFEEFNVIFRPGTSSESAAISENIYLGILDEANFFNVSSNSKRALENEREYDQAKRLFDNLSRRMRLQFQMRGKVYGKVVAMSSSRYPSDFIDRRVRERAGDPTVFYRSHAVWETQPAERYSGKYFLVDLGTRTKRPSILREGEKPVGEVLKVPIELKNEFESDLIGALRDVAGRSMPASEAFIVYPEKLKFTRRPHGAVLDTVVDGSVWPVVDERFLRVRSLVPGRRFLHLDLGVSDDAAGIAMGMVSSYVETEREGIVIRKPVIYVELLLHIVHPPGGEIQIENVQAAIEHVSRLIGTKPVISADQYQSKQLLQYFEKRGYQVEHVSVDRDTGPYEELKSAFYEGRVDCPQHPVLFGEEIGADGKVRYGGELVNLINVYDSSGHLKKIDHKPTGSKDLADAVAGVIWQCTRYAPAVESVAAPAPVRVERKSQFTKEVEDLYEELGVMPEEGDNDGFHY